MDKQGDFFTPPLFEGSIKREIYFIKGTLGWFLPNYPKTQWNNI